MSVPSTPDSPVPQSPASDALLQQVKDARFALLALHKKLLDAERARYERTNGRIPGPGILLQLVLNDPWFAWLRPISTLVVQIDERMDADVPVQTAEAESFLDQTRALLQVDDASGAFQKKYREVAEGNGEVAAAYATVLDRLKR